MNPWVASREGSQINTSSSVPPHFNGAGTQKRNNFRAFVEKTCLSPVLSRAQKGRSRGAA